MDIKICSSGSTKKYTRTNPFQWIFRRYIKIENWTCIKNGLLWLLPLLLLSLLPCIPSLLLQFNFIRFFLINSATAGTFFSIFSHLWNEKFTPAPLFVGLNYLFFNNDSDSTSFVWTSLIQWKSECLFFHFILSLKLQKKKEFELHWTSWTSLEISRKMQSLFST